MVWPFADIPPPPPEILETGIVMPSPLATIVGGTFLAFGMILLGRVLLRSKPAALQRKLLIGMGVVFFALTSLMIAWSSSAYGTYREQQRNWRPLGPIRERIPPDEHGNNEPASSSELPKAS